MYIFSNLRLLRRVTAGDNVELFCAWRKDGENEAAGANDATNQVLVDMQLCDTSEDEDENIESELESDEISERESDYE